MSSGLGGHRHTGLGQVSRPGMFIVDYDIPSDYRRQRFYRAIRRYLREHKLPDTEWSTWSVTFTENEDFAWYIHRQALKVGGTSHVYEARRLDDEP